MENNSIFILISSCTVQYMGFILKGLSVPDVVQTFNRSKHGHQLLDAKCLKAQHNASLPPPYFLCLTLCRPLTEFLPRQKTTDEAVMADVSSSLSCPRPDKQRKRILLNRIRHWQSLAVSCLSQQGLRMQRRAAATFTPIHGGSL